MKKKRNRQPRHRLLKAGCVGAGLLSISNPTQVTAADVGLYDVRNVQSLGIIPNPFPTAPFGVHVAIGDLDGDGLGDIITGPGRGPAEIAVAGTPVGKPVYDWIHHKVALGPPGANGGVSVATGNLDNDLDGKAEVIVTPASGSESTAIYIKIPDIKGELEKYAEFDNIFEGFSGGVTVATGDVDGDGQTDVLAGRLSCACGRPIKKWPPSSGLAAFEDFGPPVPSGQGGVRVAVGDIDGDDLDDYLVVPIDPTSGMSEPLMAVSGDKHKNWIQLLSFNEPGGVHVAMGDVDGDGIAELVVGSPRGELPSINVYAIVDTPGAAGKSADHKNEIEILSFGAGYRGGVRVAVGDINGDGYADIAYAPASVPEPATIASLLVGLGAWLFGWRRRKRAAPPG